MAYWHQELEKGRVVESRIDSMKGSYLGPEYTQEEIERELSEIGAVFVSIDEDELINILNYFLIFLM